MTKFVRPPIDSPTLIDQLQAENARLNQEVKGWEQAYALERGMFNDRDEQVERLTNELATLKKPQGGPLAWMLRKELWAQYNGYRKFSSHRIDGSWDVPLYTKGD